MSGVQLALDVSDLDEAIAFYSVLFGTRPAKARPGYANFAVEDPALELVLIEGAGRPGSVNHLGVEVTSSGEVAAAAQQLSGHGLATDIEEGTTCCYAVQDTVWVTGPDGADWEIATVLADADVPGPPSGDARCCVSDPAGTAPRTPLGVPPTGCC